MLLFSTKINIHLNFKKINMYNNMKNNFNCQNRNSSIHQLLTLLFFFIQSHVNFKM